MQRQRAFLLTASLLLAGTTIGGDALDLIEAVRAGNREAVRALLRTKTDVNAAEADGTTALHWAARADDLETARMLLAAGANAGAANRYGSTPLSLAALNGSPSMTEALLAAGADPNGIAADGQTMVMIAARSGNLDTVRALLDRGADPAAREDLLGETALMWAASENHGGVVSLLLARGADADARSTTLTFPKDRFGLEGVLTFLPRGNWTALMYAARDGGVDAARVLAEAGADLDAVDPEGTTALVRAIQNAHYDTAAVLIEHGANPNLADTTGMAALYAGVDMSSLGEIYGRPPRRVRDTHTALDVIRLLLEHGADPNAQLTSPTLTRAHTPGDGALGEGTTPLMRAAKHGDYRAMQVLLDHGADVSIAQKTGGTALMFAAGLGRGASPFAEDVGVEADFLKAVQLALDRGADVGATHSSGATIAHYAAQAGFSSVIALIAARGARLDLPDKRGRTPADLAMGVGVRGRAGGPAIVHPETAGLIERLLAQKGP